MLGQSSKLPLAVFGGIVLGGTIAVTLHLLLNQYPREDTVHDGSPEISTSETPEVYDANTLDTIVTSEDTQSPTEIPVASPSLSIDLESNATKTNLLFNTV